MIADPAFHKDASDRRQMAEGVLSACNDLRRRHCSMSKQKARVKTGFHAGV
jgi:hypothetical protein